MLSSKRVYQRLKLTKNKIMKDLKKDCQDKETLEGKKLREKRDKLELKIQIKKLEKELLELNKKEEEESKLLLEQ